MNLVLVIVSLFGYGFFSACKDGTLWQDEDNLRFNVWWGGNSKWVWSSDTWHRFKHLEQFCFYSAVFWATGLPWYWFIPFVLVASFLVGRTFVLFYHTLLLRKPDQTVWEWLKGTVLPWVSKR